MGRKNRLQIADDNLHLAEKVLGDIKASGETQQALARVYDFIERAHEQVIDQLSQSTPAPHRHPVGRHHEKRRASYLPIEHSVAAGVRLPSAGPNLW